MRRNVIHIVTARAIPHYGNLVIHIEEGGLESKVWYPELSRKLELTEPLLKELQIRFEEAPNEPLAERAISDLRVVQQEI
jgi:hypothetical protein